MNGITNLLGGNPIIGGLITVLAGIAFLTVEYIRLKRGARSHTRALAITLTVMSVMLMGSRFVSVVSKHGGA
jgi:hypothetical protein